jgi:UDP-glucose 4-epimerase
MTPYTYNPRVGRKLTSNYYVDMGQGLLQILEQIHREDILSLKSEKGVVKR